MVKQDSSRMVRTCPVFWSVSSWPLMAYDPLSWITGEEQYLQPPGGEWGTGNTDLCHQDHRSTGKHICLLKVEMVYWSIAAGLTGGSWQSWCLSSTGLGWWMGYLPSLISVALFKLSFEEREKPLPTSGAHQSFCLWKQILSQGSSTRDFSRAGGRMGWSWVQWQQLKWASSEGQEEDRWLWSSRKMLKCQCLVVRVASQGDLFLHLLFSQGPLKQPQEIQEGTWEVIPMALGSGERIRWSPTTWVGWEAVSWKFIQARDWEKYLCEKDNKAWVGLQEMSCASQSKRSSEGVVHCLLPKSLCSICPTDFSQAVVWGHPSYSLTMS